MDFPVAQMVKNLPAMQESWVRFLGWEDPLEKGMATVEQRVQAVVTLFVNLEDSLHLIGSIEYS